MLNIPCTWNSTIVIYVCIEYSTITYTFVCADQFLFYIQMFFHSVSTMFLVFLSVDRYTVGPFVGILLVIENSGLCAKSDTLFN